MNWSPLALLLLASCTTKEGFNEDFVEEYCGLLTACEVLDIYGYRSSSDCTDEASGLTENCDFDDEAADSCIEDIQATGCRDLWEYNLPESCSGVCKG